MLEKFTMFRLIFIRKVIIPALKAHSGLLYSTKVGKPRSTARLTLVSASVGVLVGAGYGGYTHYKVNVKRNNIIESEDYPFLSTPPVYKPQYKVQNETDPSNLQLVLFQYRTCPFCCKVRAYLDAKGISYEVVEVDAVLRQDIKWSGYKKVPILLAKVDGGYQQLMDSTAIMSVLETYLKEKNSNLPQVLKYYPVTKYVNDDGKSVTEIANKYFIMHNEAIKNEQIRKDEIEERKWREWADRVLVHTLSPNVYRTPGEALETFKWFEDVGGWRSSFPGWECNLMVYGGAIAMYFISKRLKKRHQIENERSSLYSAANKWSKALKSKGSKFHGGATPNLADISVYGVLSSIEGCQAFIDLRDNSDIGSWYDNMKEYTSKSKGRMAA